MCAIVGLSGILRILLLWLHGLRGILWLTILLLRLTVLLLWLTILRLCAVLRLTVLRLHRLLRLRRLLRLHRLLVILWLLCGLLRLHLEGCRGHGAAIALLDGRHHLGHLIGTLPLAHGLAPHARIHREAVVEQFMNLEWSSRLAILGNVVLHNLELCEVIQHILSTGHTGWAADLRP